MVRGAQCVNGMPAHLCTCGAPKYMDAMSCNACADKAERAYGAADRGRMSGISSSGSSYQDSNTCSCGNPKWPDADGCSRCHDIWADDRR